MPTGVGGGIAPNIQGRPADGSLWAFVGGAYQATPRIAVLPSGRGLSITGSPFELSDPSIKGFAPDLRFMFDGDPDAALSYLIYSHDNMSIAMDAYFDGANWIASSTNSVLLTKGANQLSIFVNTGLTKGATHSATNFAMQVRAASVTSVSSITGTVTIGDGSTVATNVSAGGGNLNAGGSIGVGSGGVYKVNGTQVVGARITGYGTPTGGANQGSFAAGSITLPNLAAGVAQLILDLKTHGLLGT